MICAGRKINAINRHKIISLINSYVGKQDLINILKVIKGIFYRQVVNVGSRTLVIWVS